MTRAATSPELALFRSPGQWSKVRAAIFTPTTIYTGRINQVFSSLDKVLELTYDAGSGTLSDVLADMTLFVGSSAGAWDKGIARVRGIDATKVYIGETADISFSDNDYLTIVDDFGLWAKPILISGGAVYMDGGVAYSNQHTNWNPFPMMGPNRVKKLTASTVSITFNFSGSYAPGSSISGYSTSAPGSLSISGSTTATPTVTWDSVGWKKVYLTLTAANGKSFFGVRYVYIWDDDNLPPLVEIKSCRGDTEAGGWEFSLTMYEDADLTSVRDHALVILFSEDHYGKWDDATATEIGPVSGCENILAVGWIGRESIDWDSEAGSVSFTAYGAHYWLTKIPAWPDGVEFTTGTPSSWTQIQSLTVDLGLYHFLMWRTTAPRVMDITVTGDTRLSKEVGSLASNIWQQLQEIAFEQIYARPLVNCLNQLYIEIHPQLTPTGSRSWPSVFTILYEDIIRPVSFDRSTMNEISILDLSGVAINSSGNATAYFSLAPGHSHTHYGVPEVQPKRLLSSQSQSNTLAALYRAWRNNKYKLIPISLAANNRLVDIAPRQKCAIAILESDTKRGITYSGNLIPLSVEWVHDRKSGYLHTDITFEGETSDTGSTSQNGDVPGSVNISLPPTPALPPLPPLDPIFPGGIEGSANGPVRVLLHDRSKGLLLSENFDDASPVWETVNSGLTATQASQINFIGICPNGAVYVGYIATADPGTGNFLARAESIGSTFTVLTIPARLRSAAVNPLLSETIGFSTGASADLSWPFHVGTYAGWSTGVNLKDYKGASCLSYGFGAWLITRYLSGGVSSAKIAGGGGSVLASGGANVVPYHLRASTTGRTFHETNGSDALIKGESNLGSSSTVSSGNSIIFDPGVGDRPLVADCDPTGVYIMSRGLGGLGGGKAKSSDNGATWSGLPSLPASAGYAFGYAGPGEPQRFIAVAGVVRYTPDFGTTWENKEGNITSIAPIPDLDMVKVLEY